MPDNVQSNTQSGPIRLPVRNGTNLTGMEGRLVRIVDDGGKASVDFGVFSDRCPYILLEGADSGELATLEALQPGKNYRGVLKGTCSAGAVLNMQQDPGSDMGKLQAFTNNPGDWFIAGIAEEAGVDGQYILFRPHVLSVLKVAAP